MSSTVDPPIPATVNGNAPTKKRDILERYQRWMTRNPLKARCFTYAVIGAVGSMIGSRKARGPRKPKVIDWLEVVSFAMHGGLVGGPLSHYMWAIEKNTDCRKKKTGNSSAKIGKKVSVAISSNMLRFFFSVFLRYHAGTVFLKKISMTQSLILFSSISWFFSRLSSF